MTPNEDVLKRIHKLMALSQNNANEHEAALAASRMQDLLMEHGLSMAEIGNPESKTASAADSKRVKDAHDKSAMYEYQRSLMGALARNNFLHYWTEERFRTDPKGRRTNFNASTQKLEKGRWVKMHVLLGREENVVATQVMYDYLVSTMDRLLPWQGMEKRGKDALLWLAGCTDRLVDRLNEARYAKEREMERLREENEARMAGAAQVGALIRMSDVYSNETDLNDDFRYGYEPGTTARQRAEYKVKNDAYWEKQQELMALGMEQNDAWYVSRGLPAPEKEVRKEDVETPKEKEKREARERREEAQNEARWDRQRAKAREKTSSAAFKLGSETGDSIGLNSQIRTTQNKEVA